MEGDDGPADLRAAHPQWRIWRLGNVAYARRLRTTPQVLLRDSSFAGLAQRIPLAEAAMKKEPYSWRRVMKAAGELKEET